jgi:16S rRNA (adenine1518-N6/adenine1519-N6)-dimethyltransferase
VAKDYALFENIVKCAFQMRRKTLRNSLKKIIDDSAWAHITVHSDCRPENLSVKDFVEISNAISALEGK